jgi:hypothetical protein
MQLFKQHLFGALHTFDDSLTMSYLDHKFLWNIDSDPMYLTFIDIIKGIIPGFLVEKILRVSNNRKYAIDLLQILYLVFQSVYLVSDFFDRYLLSDCYLNKIQINRSNYR